MLCFEVGNVMLSETNFIHVGQKRGKVCPHVFFSGIATFQPFILTKTLLNSSSSQANSNGVSSRFMMSSGTNVSICLLFKVALPVCMKEIHNIVFVLDIAYVCVFQL